jgi:putative FmdB family regulatory protein
MATYQYRCVQHGDFDVSRPIGTAAPKSQCPVCDTEAARVFRAPMLSFAPRALVAEIDRTEKTSDEPEVVSALPPRAGRRRNPIATQNPAWQRLPRP